MKYRLLIFCLVLSLFAFCAGCETAGGVGTGLAYGIDSTARGMVKDTRNTYGFITAVDRWMRKNLW